MSIRDLLDMAKRNLLARKLRTGLTLLGVVIGCTSILLMLGFGYGISENNRRMMESFGDVKNISVTESTKEQGAGTTNKRLTDRSIGELEKIPHVVDVTPIYTTELEMSYRSYRTDFISITAMEKETYSKLDWTMESGSPFHGNGEGEIIFGTSVIKNFYDPDAPPDTPSMEDGAEEAPPLFNPSGKKMIVSPSTFMPNFGMGGAPSSDQNKKEAELKVSGIVAKTKKMAYDQGAFMTLEGYQALTKKLGLPVPEKGRYESLQVRIDDMNNAEDVSNAIKDLGYESSGMLEMIQEMNKALAIINAIFAGIGSIAFVVAAIGIANTMIMSIYERTREIGVMKVIGASIQDIKRLFLTEAALIGFIGGVMGVAISLLFSWGFNLIGNRYAAMQGAEETVTLSYIPLWLILVALIFSTLVGIAAGYFPAKRAMNLSALDAIRTE